MQQRSPDSSSSPAVQPTDAQAPEASPLERILDQVAEPAVPLQQEPVVSLRTARLLSVQGQSAAIAWRTSARPVTAQLASDLEPALAQQALAQGEMVLVECCPGQQPVVVGVVQTRLSNLSTLQAKTLTLEADQEILLRSGRAALRLRADGDIEIVGSRIQAASRGLFRLVGRILRLN